MHRPDPSTRFAIRAARAAASILLLAASGAAQTLVFDVNAEPPEVPTSSSPRDVAFLNGTAFFKANFPVIGTEMGVSDGTAGGTGVFLDVNPGVDSSLAGPFVEVGGKLFFSASTDAAGGELWATDGTVGGTELVADINPGILSSFPKELTAFGSLLFFTAKDSTTGRELWCSDGTEAGTQRVIDIHPSPFVGSDPTQMTVAGGLLFFSADDGTNGRELWVTDGTELGTALVEDLQPGGGSSSPQDLVDLSGTLIFTASVSGLGREVWSSDGTPGGTALILDVGPGISAEAEELTVLGGEVFFSASSASFDEELWKTDGTAGGTVQVLDIVPAGESAPESLVVAGGTLFFTADDGVHGRELWASDGTGAGTAMVADLAPGASSLTLHQAAALGSELLFSFSGGGVQAELWKSDGTGAGTELVADIAPIGSSSPQHFAVGAGRLWFSADDGIVGRELWSSDGTGAGTMLMGDLKPTPISQPSSPSVLGELPGVTVFAADDGVHGTEPWSTDGTAQGTQLLADVMVGEDSSYPIRPAVFMNRVFFVADDSGSILTNYELWATDGTPAGTGLFADLEPNFASNPNNLYATPDGLFFTATTQSAGAEPWVIGLDGVPRALGDLNPGVSYSSAKEYFALGDTVLFQARTDTVGEELFRTDGTAPGTELVADIQPGLGSSQPRDFVQLGDVALFVADGPEGDELWSTDGTAEGTELVKDIRKGTLSSDPEQLTRIGERVFFLAEPAFGVRLFVTDGTPAGTEEVAGPVPDEIVAFGDAVLTRSHSQVWISDGTPAGTELLLDAPTSGLIGLTSIEVAGDLAYLAVDVSSFHGATQLWKTDGTVAGTELVLELLPGGQPISLAATIDHLTAVGAGRELVFQGNDFTNGAELWLTDGSAQGTSPVGDVAPGQASSNPTPVGRAGGSLLISADDGTLGRELYRVPFADTGGYLYEPFGDGCVSPATGVRPAMTASGTLVLGDSFDLELAQAPPQATALLYVSYGTTEGVFGVGCTFYLAPAFVFVDFAITDGNGAGAVTLDVPLQSSLVGPPIFFQYLVADTGGPVAGIATLSNAVEALVGS